MNWKTISLWSNRAVYIAAVVAAFIRAIHLFSANGNGYFAGTLGAIAAEGMTLACYSKIMAGEVATLRQKRTLIIGTYIGLFISITIQITEYWIATPEAAGTLLGIVAPSSATVAMCILITVELTGNVAATAATVAATDKTEIEAILGALDVMGQTIATLTQQPQQPIDVALLLQDVAATVQHQMQHERNSISAAMQQMQQALEDMQRNATLQIVAPAGPQQMQQMQQLQHAEPLRTCCNCGKPIATGNKCSTCRSRDSRNSRNATAGAVAATDEVTA